ncbi:kinase-like domain-containing protein [Rhizophagus diaphanus]|nr:kinase-like domain-containing protein [Rhizophagus diaphanus] [Rhizophagus sp. MUCL 43196]
MDETPKNLWMYDHMSRCHVTILTIDSTIESENLDEDIVYIGDLEKRKQAFKNNFKNWTSGNKDIDEFIQQSQLNAVHYKKCLEWIPFEKFYNITYIAEGGFGKIYSAEWPEGHIEYWDIENQKWCRMQNDKYALKSLNNSSDICSDFLNEIRSHLQIYLNDVVQCFGITQYPNNKELKIDQLQQIARGLLDIHNVEKVHKDFHSGNILFNGPPYISDLGMCQPANIKQTVKEEGIYGVLPYMALEVLRG